VVGRDFDPWQAVDKHADLSVLFHPVAGLMGGGFHARTHGRAVIVLDPDLDGPMRRAVLTHELVHHERGGGPGRSGAPATLDLLVERDERAVDAEVARRLLPVDELDRVVTELVACTGSASVIDVAAHFAVPSEVARCALAQLAARAARSPAGYTDSKTGSVA
jgi:IrrE N-terminal-like domain